MFLKFYLIICIICSEKISVYRVRNIRTFKNNILCVDIRTPLKVTFDTKSITDAWLRLTVQYISHLLTVLSQILKKTPILSCRLKSKGRFTCGHAPYTHLANV